jgi:hypothetical protein
MFSYKNYTKKRPNGRFRGKVGIVAEMRISDSDDFF